MNEDERLWHVTVMIAGPPTDRETVGKALRTLNARRPFLHSMQYDADRAEFRFWEEAETLLDSASLALRVWNEHKVAVGLPAWTVVGFEVLQRPQYLRRHHEWAETVSVPGISPLHF